MSKAEPCSVLLLCADSEVLVDFLRKIRPVADLFYLKQHKPTCCHSILPH